WTDDNSVHGSSPDAAATEGPYMIDNLRVSPGDPPPPPYLHPVTVEQCRDTNFTVIVFGPASHYQWFENNVPVGGDSPTLTITNAGLPDNNSDIFVRISSSFGSVESAHVKLFVTPDTTPPTVDSATAKVDGTNVVVVFSERMDPDLTSGAQATSSYHLRAPDGITTTEPVAAMLGPDGRTLTLTFDTPRTPKVGYQLLIDPAMGDACHPLENILTGPINEEGRIIAPLKFEVYLMTFANSHWRYKAGYDNPGVVWRSDPNFDDSLWPEDLSVFDGKQETTGFTATPRANVGNMTVTTQ